MVTVLELSAVPANAGVTAALAQIYGSGLPPAVAAPLLIQALTSSGVSPAAAQAAVALAGTGAGATAPGVAGATSSVGTAASVDVGQAAILYDAAYLLAAARRLDRATVQAVHTGTTATTPSPVQGASWTVHAELRSRLADALQTERGYRRLHDQAQQHRRAAARQVDGAAVAYGGQLGWYLGAAKVHTPVCAAAAGHDFSATARPLPGWPGATHSRCACKAGPPHRSKLTVDEVTRPLLARGLD